MDIIPEDVWPLIVKFMDDKTKRWMRLANTKWFNIIKYDDFKLYFTQSKDMGAISDRLSKYSWPIKVRFNKTKISDSVNFISNLSKMTNIVELSSDRYDRKFDIPFGQLTPDQWLQLTTLTNLKLWGINAAQYYIPDGLWKKLTKLTEFSIQGAELNISVPAEQLIAHLPDLESFLFFADSNTWPYALPPNPHKLTKLHISPRIPFEHGSEYLPHLTNLKRLIFNDYDFEHTMDLSYLTALEEVAYYGKLPSFGVTNANLTSLKMECQLSRPSTEQFSNLKNLRHIQIYVAANQQEPIDFGFLSSFLQLWSFSIAGLRDEPQKVPISSFQNLKPNLTHFTGRHCPVDLAHLTHLTNLESLILHESPTDIESISQLSKLTNLSVNQSSAEQSWRSIENLTNLVLLHLNVGRNINNPPIEQNLPNLTRLNNLKELYWGLNGFPTKISEQIRLLTRLTHLTVAPNQGKYQGSIENCNFLKELTNLIELTVAVAVNDVGSQWQNVSTLTKLNRLSIHKIDNDDELLWLTSLINLTSLSIQNPSQNFYGLHFTALTSLQLLNISAAHEKLVLVEELTRIMPYLVEATYHKY